MKAVSPSTTPPARPQATPTAPIEALQPPPVPPPQDSPGIYRTNESQMIWVSDEMNPEKEQNTIGRIEPETEFQVLEIFSYGPNHIRARPRLGWNYDAGWISLVWTVDGVVHRSARRLVPQPSPCLSTASTRVPSPDAAVPAQTTVLPGPSVSAPPPEASTKHAAFLAELADLKKALLSTGATAEEAEQAVRDEIKKAGHIEVSEASAPFTPSPTQPAPETLEETMRTYP